MFKVRALARLHGDKIPDGYQNRGNTFFVDRDTAYELAGARSVEILEGDGLQPGFETHEGGAPSTSETNAAPLSSSPPGSPPDSSTSAPSPDGPSSQSATATDSGRASKQSTQRTSGGGRTTKKPSNSRTLKPTDGARTAKRAGTLTSDGSNPQTPPASVSDPATSTPE
jgi:hypothetical protein